MRSPVTHTFDPLSTIESGGECVRWMRTDVLASLCKPQTRVVQDRHVTLRGGGGIVMSETVPKVRLGTRATVMGEGGVGREYSSNRQFGGNWTGRVEIEAGNRMGGGGGSAGGGGSMIPDHAVSQNHSQCGRGGGMTRTNASTRVVP